jgi:hypothetical protein
MARKMESLSLENILTNEETREYAYGISHGMKSSITSWDGMKSVPPASILFDVVEIFEEATDIPLEIPMFLLIHMISGRLTELDITVKVEGSPKKEFVDLWTILLAESGSGKSAVADFLSDWVDYGNFIPSVGTDAGFIASLDECNGKGLLIHDEVSELIRDLEMKKGNTSMLRSYILTCATNNKVERKLKKTHTIIKKPSISFLGLNTKQAFLMELSDKSMVDGLARRWRYIIVNDDEDRIARDKYEKGWRFPSDSEERIKNAWDLLFSKIVRGTVYTISKEAEDRLDKIYEKTVDSYGGIIPKAFFRTTSRTIYKYSVIYHLMKNDGTTEIGVDSIIWAQTLVDSHMVDGAELIAEFNMPDLERLILRAEAIKHKAEAKGEKFSTRHLTKGMREITNVSMAKGLMAMVQEKTEYKQKELPL